MIKVRVQLPAGVMAVAKDRLGRTVTITHERWEHVVERHPEMHGLDLAVKRAIEVADDRLDGNRAGRDKLYAPNLGPASWLVVVVEYRANGQGKMITAYASAKGPYPVAEGSE